jgi:predicted Zn-dependent peptidase
MLALTSALIIAAIAAPPTPATGVVRQVLPSGVHLIVSPRPAARLVAIEIRVRGVGSGHETPEENGLAHAVEHMLFKGTDAKTPGAFDGEFERMGGEASAQTFRDGTAFRVCVLPERWKDALTTWSELLQKPAFREADWATERTIILREMNVAQSETAKLGLQTLASIAYPAADPYAQPLMGSRANVERFTAGDLRAFHAKRYVPANLTIAVSGPVTAEEVASVVGAQWAVGGGISGGPPAPNFGGAGGVASVSAGVPEPNVHAGEAGSSTNPPAPPELDEGRLPGVGGPPEIPASAPVRAPLFTDDEQTARKLATVYLGFRAPRLQTDPNSAAACDVLAAMLARGMGGILGDRLTGDKKLNTISVSANYMPQADRALFVIQASSDKRDIGQIEDVIIEELGNLKVRCASDDVGLEDLLEDAKSAAIGEERRQRDTVDGEAKYLAYIDMLKAPGDYDTRYAELVNKVSLVDIERLLDRYVIPTKRNVAVIGLSAIGAAASAAAPTEPEAVK